MNSDERARLGASLLDEHVPDWTERVDVDALDMESCTRCVLGQLLGSFWELRNAPIGPLTLSNVEDYGFDSTSLTSADEQARDYAALGEAWAHEILSRRVEAHS